MKAINTKSFRYFTLAALVLACSPSIHGADADTGADADASSFNITSLGKKAAALVTFLTALRFYTKDRGATDTDKYTLDFPSSLDDITALFDNGLIGRRGTESSTIRGNKISITKNKDYSGVLGTADYYGPKVLKAAGAVAALLAFQESLKKVKNFNNFCVATWLKDLIQDFVNDVTGQSTAA